MKKKLQRETHHFLCSFFLYDFYISLLVVNQLAAIVPAVKLTKL